MMLVLNAVKGDQKHYYKSCMTVLIHHPATTHAFNTYGKESNDCAHE